MSRVQQQVNDEVLVQNTVGQESVYLDAWLISERRAAAAIASEKFSWSDLVVNPDNFDQRRKGMSAAYYESMHLKSEDYKKHNWLLASKDRIDLAGTKRLVELGAGNCGFSTYAATAVEKVFALDWALSPPGPLPSNVEMVTCDITAAPIPDADVCCSADFFEHIAPSDLHKLVRKISNAARGHFHVIACYDDAHSHLTIMPPGAWLGLFKRVSPDFELSSLHCRRDDPRQVVCTIERQPRSAPNG